MSAPGRPNLNEIQAPLACLRCGGTHFYTVQVDQYTGDHEKRTHIRALTNGGRQVRLCVGCSTPLNEILKAETSGLARRGQDEQLAESLASGKKYRDKVAALLNEPEE